MAITRVPTLLQTGADLMAASEAATDAHLRRENERLNSELSRLRQRVLELEHAADTDPLVPVYNRRAFMREVSRAQTVMSRYEILSSLIFLDLNGFKSINDRYGHGIGDQLLKKTGSVLIAGVRECDMVARLGGDEFGVLLFKTDPHIAKAKAAALTCRIAEQYVSMPTGKIRVSAAWGVAPCEAGETAEQILSRADRAMYVAKRNKE